MINDLKAYVYSYAKQFTRPFMISEISNMPVFCSVPRQDIAASLYELAACRLLFRSVKDGKAYYSNDEMDGEWCNSMSRYLAQHIYNMRKASFDFGNGITVTSHGSGKSELVCEGLRREEERVEKMDILDSLLSLFATDSKIPDKYLNLSYKKKNEFEFQETIFSIPDDFSAGVANGETLNIKSNIGFNDYEKKVFVSNFKALIKPHNITEEFRKQLDKKDMPYMEPPLISKALGRVHAYRLVFPDLFDKYGFDYKKIRFVEFDADNSYVYGLYELMNGNLLRVLSSLSVCNCTFVMLMEINGVVNQNLHKALEVIRDFTERIRSKNIPAFCKLNDIKWKAEPDKTYLADWCKAVDMATKNGIAKAMNLWTNASEAEYEYKATNGIYDDDNLGMYSTFYTAELLPAVKLREHFADEALETLKYVYTNYPHNAYLKQLSDEAAKICDFSRKNVSISDEEGNVGKILWALEPLEEYYKAAFYNPIKYADKDQWIKEKKKETQKQNAAIFSVYDNASMSFGADRRGEIDEKIDRDSEITFGGKHFVLSNFDDGDETGEMAEKIKSAGGIIHSTMVKMADYLVINTKASYVGMRKFEKALEWRTKGSKVKIITGDMAESALRGEYRPEKLTESFDNAEHIKDESENTHEKIADVSISGGEPSQSISKPAAHKKTERKSKIDNNFSEHNQEKSLEVMQIESGSVTYYEFGSLTADDVLVIPEGVHTIESYVFSGGEFRKIVFPASLRSICEGAFSDCKNLTEICVPDTVKEIMNGAFSLCENLQTVKLPAGLTKISEDCFLCCSKLKNITIPSGVKTIERRAFSSCDSLQNIVIPEQINTIGEEAFRYCGVSEITLPKSLISVGPEAFKFSKISCVRIENPKTVLGSECFRPDDATKELRIYGPLSVKKKAIETATPAKGIVTFHTTDDLNSGNSQGTRNTMQARLSENDSSHMSTHPVNSTPDAPEIAKRIASIQNQIHSLEVEQASMHGLFAGLRKKKLQRQIDELNNELKNLRRK